MKIIMPNGQTMEEFFAEVDKELAKKNLRNWINNKFPKGIADHAAAYALTHPWIIVKYAIWEIKYAWQRVFRGWDDRAVWSIDYYLAKLIPQMVKELKRIGYGTPMSMYDGLPFEDEENYTYSKETDEIAHERWNTILDTIIEGFSMYFDDKYDCLPNGIHSDKEAEEKFNKAFDLFKENFSHLWW